MSYYQNIYKNFHHIKLLSILHHCKDIKLNKMLNKTTLMSYLLTIFKFLCPVVNAIIIEYIIAIFVI